MNSPEPIWSVYAPSTLGVLNCCIMIRDKMTSDVLCKEPVYINTTVHVQEDLSEMRYQVYSSLVAGKSVVV